MAPAAYRGYTCADDFGGDLALTRVVKPEVHAEGQMTS